MFGEWRVDWVSTPTGLLGLTLLCTEQPAQLYMAITDPTQCAWMGMPPTNCCEPPAQMGAVVTERLHCCIRTDQG